MGTLPEEKESRQADDSTGKSHKNQQFGASRD
jgi:hypothetical protein